MSAHGMPTSFAAPRECEHVWESVSFAFETQLLDSLGRVQVRQPDVDQGRVYFLCRLCASHTYMTTQFLGARMYGSEDASPPDPDGLDRYVSGWSRDAWVLEDDDELTAEPKPTDSDPYDDFCPTCDAPEPTHTPTCAVVHKSTNSGKES